MADPEATPPKIKRIERIAVPRAARKSMGATKAAVAPIDAASQLATVTAKPKGVTQFARETVRLWTPKDWQPLDFPINEPAEATAFVTGAFRHAGWRLLEDFQGDLRGAYSGFREKQRTLIPSAARTNLAQVQMKAAMDVLRPRVAAALLAAEDAAIALLRERLNSTIESGRTQARALLNMPKMGGRRLDPESLLAGMENPTAALKKNSPTLRSDSAEAKLLRENLAALAPSAAALASWESAKAFAEARKRISQAAAVLAKVAPSVQPLTAMADGADLALKYAAARDEAGEALARLLGEYEDVLAEWRTASAAYVLQRRAVASILPLMHRMGCRDVVAAQSESDADLGWRVAQILSSVHGGALTVRARCFRGGQQETVRMHRPARALVKAVAGTEPPNDPVKFVMQKRGSSVWEYDSLIQATALQRSRDYFSAAGPQGLLDSFFASTVEQALAEKAAQQREEMFGQAALALGLGAGLAALHFVAPPVAIAIDASLASHDLLKESAELEKQSAASRCAFDQAEALGEEPSLAFFLVSQAVNVLTVG